jgi:hypothetical protein
MTVTVIVTFYDSDYNVEEGDDDILNDNVDTSLNNYIEKAVYDGHEDEDVDACKMHPGTLKFSSMCYDFILAYYLRYYVFN